LSNAARCSSSGFSSGREARGREEPEIFGGFAIRLKWDELFRRASAAMSFGHNQLAYSLAISGEIFAFGSRERLDALALIVTQD
jgi:hypothetical protein